jgi:hypothetical protein
MCHSFAPHELTIRLFVLWKYVEFYAVSHSVEALFLELKSGLFCMDGRTVCGFD